MGKGRENNPRRELVFESPNRLFPSVFRGLKFQPRREEKLEPVVQLSTDCRPHALPQTRSLPPARSRLISSPQPGNQWETNTPKHNAAVRGGVRMQRPRQSNLTLGWKAVSPVVCCMFFCLFRLHSWKTLREEKINGGRSRGVPSGT